jgi:hypothetical protein
MKNQLVSKVSLYSNLLMILTSLHHVYGAIIYNTPWRNHVLLVSIPVMVITVLLKNYLSKNQFTAKSFRFWLLWIIILIPSLALIGMFEGVYNHIIKNIMFFGGASGALLMQLFPPPKYEMPDDFIFELTGILQGILVVPVALYLVQLTKSVLANHKASD